MLLLINNASRLSPAEQRFAEWIQWSPAQPGVALLNIHVPNRGHTHQIDALLWTPQQCVVVEVKGFRTRQDGVLRIPPNGPWRMADGRVADIYGNDHGHNPMDQVFANTMAAKNQLSASTGRRRYVHGLVLVMLLPGQDVPSLDYGDLPRDTTIVVEDFDVFRYYLDTFSDDPVQWSSDQVAEAIDNLGLEHLYDSRYQLAAALGEASTYQARVDVGDAPF